MLLQELRRALRQKPFNLRDIRTWNSPERRSSITGMVLTPIPIELYDLIFSFVIPCSDGESEESTLKRMKDLRSLSVVCRLFCAEILPLVFRSVVFQNTEETAVSRNQMSYVPFCASLKNGEIFAESLALQVQQCTIRDWIGASNLADFFLASSC
ncbi:hypothetical protein BDP27DRAFT_565562 [Rhodocollybia butyracea]|uniref:Uncharacterized protein n=1 Tax=Rhodocollybia butyracea TaxID=206335 RepID=A0A9P5P7S3_9AGAR|nr:hypothetical protein BDP27DRAFT_565562 [Rhodocollybia butyracea]